MHWDVPKIFRTQPPTPQQDFGTHQSINQSINKLYLPSNLQCMDVILKIPDNKNVGCRNLALYGRGGGGDGGCR